jgi:hypothetical protein
MGAARAKRQNIVMLLKRQRGPVLAAKSGDRRGFGEDLDPLWPLRVKVSIRVAISVTPAGLRPLLEPSLHVIDQAGNSRRSESLPIRVSPERSWRRDRAMMPM